MASTFFGLTIGSSALTTYQAAINTTANNISNVRTEGYTRQTTEISATSALRVNAKYGSVGTGVEATEISQARSLYYDTKYWETNSSYGLYEQKLYYLDQIESVFADDSVQTGFSTIFANMFNGLDSLITDGASDGSARNQFINKAQSLCTYFNSLYTSLQDIQKDCNEEIKTNVENINSISEKIALLNREIYNLEVRGGSANELRDQRNSLIDELSKIVTVETEEVEVFNSNGENLGATTYRVYVNGQELVDGFENRTIECTSSDYKNNQTDIDGLYSIVWSDTKMSFNATSTSAGGTLKALFEMRDGNNAETLKGTVAAADADTITLTGINITDVANLSLAEKGTVTIEGGVYYYSSFTMEMDETGTVSGITLNLTPGKNDANQLNRLNGKNSDAVCGSEVDSMGIPYYMSQINSFLRNFAKAFNDIERSGETLDGETMGSFFTATTVTGNEYDFGDQYGANGATTFSNSDSTYYTLTAQTVGVNAKSIKNSNYFSTAATMTDGKDAYDIVTQLKTLQSEKTMFRGDNAEKFLETLISDVAVDTNKNQIFCQNYENLVSAVDNQRTSVSGVDEDEEALDLVKFQNAYNLASKVISVMAELYDKLINETGL